MSSGQSGAGPSGSSSSGRAQRTRKPAQRFGDALSWQEASLQKRASGSGRREVAAQSRNDDGEGEDEDSPNSSADDAFQDDDVLSDDVSDSEDDYQPDDEDDDEAALRRTDRSRHEQRAGGSQVARRLAELEGDDDLFGSSDEDDGQRILHRPRDGEGDDDEMQIDEQQSSDQGSELDQEPRGAWQTSAARKRQEQVEPEDGEAEDLPPEMIRALASAFANEDQNTGAQQEQWSLAMDAGGAEDEEINDEEYMEDVRGAMGFRSRKNRGKGGKGRRGPRQAEVSPEVRGLLAEANDAYIMDDIEKARTLFREVIRLDATVRSAWATLAVIYEQEGRENEALHHRFFEACLTPNSLKLFVSLADRSKDLGLMQQAVHCLDQAIKRSRQPDRSDVWDLMYERAMTYLDLQDYKGAIHSLGRLLQYLPHDKTVVLQLATAHYQSKSFDKAIEILEASQEWNFANFAGPSNDYSSASNGLAGPSTWDGDTIATLADLYLQTGQPAKAVTTLRRGVRWQQHRAHERFWDQVGDDREYDFERDQRTEQFGRHIELAEVHHLPDGLRFFLGLARARLGDVDDALYHLRHWSESRLPLRAEDTDSSTLSELGQLVDAYLTVADLLEKASEATDRSDEERKRASMERQILLDDALQIADDITKEGAEADDELMCDNVVRLGKCQAARGSIDEAIESFEWVTVHRESDPDFVMSLASLYEERNGDGDRIRAVTLVDKAMRQEREKRARARQAFVQAEPLAAAAAQGPSTQYTSLFAEENSAQSITRGTGVAEREQRKLREEEIVHQTVSRYKRLKEKQKYVFQPGWWSHDYAMAGDPDHFAFGKKESRSERRSRFSHVRAWMEDAEVLIDMFCNTGQLYSSDRSKKFTGVIRTHRKRNNDFDSQAQAMLARLNDSGRSGNVTVESADFRGIKLDDWTRLIMEYAFILTKTGDYAIASSILGQVLTSTIIYGSWPRRKMIHLCQASCAMYVSDHGEVVECLKNFMNEYQFHTEPLRIMLTLANSIGPDAASVMNAQHTTKMFLRRSRQHEHIARNLNCTFNHRTRKWVIPPQIGGSRLKNRNRAQQGKKGRSDLYDDSGEDEEDDDDEAGLDPKPDERSASASSRTTIWPDIKRSVDAVKVRPPTKYNPANEMFYSNQLLLSNNGIPSMAYWMRIFAHQQNDALICLTAAIACVGRATNRQVDNRHHVVLQAYALMHHYRELRKKQAVAAVSQEEQASVVPSISGTRVLETSTLRKVDGQIKLPEVDYNFGRLAHHLALYQLAVPHYRAVLRAWDEKQDAQAVKMEFAEDSQDSNQEPPSLVPGFDAVAEAAFNLHLIYTSIGSTALANDIMERYLCV